MKNIVFANNKTNRFDNAYQFEELDGRMWDWIKTTRAKNLPVTGAVIQSNSW